MEQEKILEVIKKCLALSTSSNEHEAAAAAAKAQELLFKHNLSMAQVEDIQEVSAVGESHENYHVSKNEGFWIRDLAFAVAKFNFCEAMVGSRHGHNWITFIGEKHNMEVTSEIFKWLAGQLSPLAREAWKVYNASNGYERKGAFRRGFFEGAVSTIRHRLFEQWMTLQRQDEKSTALVVIKGKEVSEYVENRFPHAKAAKDTFLSGCDGHRAGREAGERVSLTSQRKLN